MYTMLHEINMVARDHPLIGLKKERAGDASDSTDIVDPDKFPIQRLSRDLIKEYESLWHTEQAVQLVE